MAHWKRQVAIWIAALTCFTPSLANPLPPSQDDWYTQPVNISDYAPGELIRTRQVSNTLQSLLGLPVDVSVDAVHQYLFRTTDSLHNAVAAATTLIIPHNSDPSKLLSYQIIYDSPNIDCSPSYTLRGGSDIGGIPGVLLPNGKFSSDTPYIAAALNQGWWVVIPDYEGLQAQFTAGLQAGHATLDSVRVVLEEGQKIGLSKTPRYALWGYSGGALATGWAAELQPAYAPELAFVGAAMGGTIPNTRSVFNSIRGGTEAGLGFSATSGLSKAYPALAEWFDENIVPSKRKAFFDISERCWLGALEKGAFQDIASFFKNGEASLSDRIPVEALRAGGEMGRHGTPSMPLYIYKASHDQVSPVGDTDALVKKYCGNGATVYYRTDLIGSHNTPFFLGAPDAIKWLSDRLAGKAMSHLGSCVTKEVLLEPADPEGILLIGETLWAYLVSTLGGSLGPWK